MTSPSAQPLRAPRVDLDFRLSAVDRRSVAPGFDADALERLLAHITPERRAEFLSYFQLQPGNAQAHGWIVALADPSLQPLLDEVWATMWDHVGATDAEIAADVYQFPGREIAAQRRMAARRNTEKNHD